MLSPTAGGSDRCGVADLSTASVDSRGRGTVAASVPVTGPSGPVACAVAVLSTDPASRSACVPRYDAVQLMVPPGGSDTGGGGFGVQSSAGSSGSETVTPVSVTLPVLV